MTSRAIATLCMIVLAAAAGRVAAQGLRGTATSTVRYIQIRPIQRDTIPVTAVHQDSNGATTYEGVPITCVPGFPYCVRYRAGDLEDAVAFSLPHRGSAGFRRLIGRAEHRTRPETRVLITRLMDAPRGPDLTNPARGGAEVAGNHVNGRVS